MNKSYTTPALPLERNVSRELSLLKYKFEVPEVPFKRLTYTQVLEDLKRQGVTIPWGEDIPTEAFRELGKLYPFFYFITDWPTHAKAFYIKPRDDKPEVCEGFDLCGATSSWFQAEQESAKKTN